MRGLFYAQGLLCALDGGGLGFILLSVQPQAGLVVHVIVVTIIHTTRFIASKKESYIIRYIFFIAVIKYIPQFVEALLRQVEAV